MERSIESRAPRRGALLVGGGAPAVAQAGLIEGLDCIHSLQAVIGTGLGGLIGAVWACEGDLAHLCGVLAHMSWRRLRRDLDGFLRLVTKGRRFDQLHRAFAVAACDLTAGRAHVLREGSVAEAVRAGLGLPGAVRPVLASGRLWADAAYCGGPQAADVRALGADEVWALDAEPSRPSGRSAARAALWASRAAWVGHPHARAGVDVQLHASIPDGDVLDTERLQAWRTAGLKATESAVADRLAPLSTPRRTKSGE